jgi:hypothetical protein
VDREGQIGQRIDIPEDAGQVVIADTPGTYAWVGNLVENRQAIAWGLAAVTLGLFGLALLATRDRRVGLRNAGLVLAAAAVLTLVALFVAKDVTSSFARNPDVAHSALDMLMSGLRFQAWMMLLLGAFVAVGAALAGPSSAATSFRGIFRASTPRGERGSTVQGFMREQQGLLRIVGFAVAALALVAWPDPSARVYVTILVLLAVYIAALAVMTSDAEWARSSRGRINQLWARYFATTEPAHSPGVWVSVHANLLMAAGVGLALLVLVLSPDLTMRRFVVVLALTFVYLAAIEWMGRRREPAP